MLTGVHEQPFFSVAHRWRYALVGGPTGADFLWDVAPGLRANGDWRLESRLEAAFDSGEAPAETIQETQGPGLVV